MNGWKAKFDANLVAFCVAEISPGISGFTQEKGFMNICEPCICLWLILQPVKPSMLCPLGNMLKDMCLHTELAVNELRVIIHPFTKL